jgi:alcohol/geraniol dehydrogenase (NADP+)
MTTGFAATEPGGELKEFQYDLGPIGDHQVDVKVDYCGLCYSDISMLDNHWGMTRYPFVPGHEIIGKIEAMGTHVKGLTIGQIVGVGWSSGSCGTCEWCLTGNHNLCAANVPTVLGPYGGFADRVRANAEWVLPIPVALLPEAVAPLLCGGITVFNPLLEFDIKPVHRVGVIGIGGLGHMALRFLRAWGCEVTAFSHNIGKAEDAKVFGAHHFVNSTDSAALAKLANSFDFILSTVNIPLDWNAYIAALRPKGKLVFVGAVLEPAQIGLFSMAIGQKMISGNIIGSPPNMATMLNFAARHNVLPRIETFSFSRVNEAIEKLRQGKVRYRAVLEY